MKNIFFVLLVMCNVCKGQSVFDSTQISFSDIQINGITICYTTFTSNENAASIVFPDSSIRIMGDTVELIKQMLLWQMKNMEDNSRERDSLKNVIKSQQRLIYYGIEWHNTIRQTEKVRDCLAYQAYVDELIKNGFKLQPMKLSKRTRCKK